MRVRRVEPVDRLTDRRDSLLLYERQIVRLGPIGTAIFEAAGIPIGLHDLAGRLEREFGAPADGGTELATQAAVDDLVAQGVLTIEPEPDADGVAANGADEFC